MNRIKVLGLDPGSEYCGWGLVDFAHGDPEPRHIEHDVIKPGGKSVEARIRSLHWHLDRLCKRLKPNQVGLEDGYVGKGARSSLVIAETRAACIIGTGRIPIERYQPSTARKSTIGKGSADKWYVSRCLQQILGLPGMPQYDASDALCVAICHVNHLVEKEILANGR